MSPRERILAFAVLGVIAIWGGFTLTKKLIIQPFDKQRDDILNARIKLEELETKRDVELARAHTAYKKLSRKTLAADNEVAMRRFREDLNSLLEKHRFNRNELTVKAQSISTNKDGTSVLPVSVSTKGKLKDVVALLLDLYSRNYLLRVDSLNLIAEQESKAEKKKRGNRRNEDGPNLTINLAVSTLTIPQMSHPGFDEIPLEPLEEIGPAEEPVLAFALPEYDRITRDNLFAEYVAPPPVREKPKPKPQDDRPKVVVDDKPDVEVKPVIDPRKDAEHFKLVASTSLRGEPAVYVKDTRGADSAEPYQLNDEIDDGVLVLVTPRGMVVRSTAGKFAGQDFYYKLGDTFTDRVELDPREYPDLAAMLKRAFANES